MTRKPDAPDIVVVIAILVMAILAAMLCFQAARDPRIRLIMPIFIIGLTGGGIVLFRQLRKARESLVASEARAQYSARHDDLTRLPNRILVGERLAQAMEVRRRGDLDWVTVSYIGLNRLHEVVESLGLTAADQAVLEITQRLGAECREDDTLGRIGEEEFIIISGGPPAGAVLERADRIIRSLSAPIDTSGGRAFVSGSIGVSCVRSADDLPGETLRRAKLAMTDARRRGDGGACLFEAKMDHARKSRRQMEDELRSGLAQGDLEMVYQPQTSEKGVIFGVEALMRWTSPTLGAVSPSIFVPLAESCGLSEAIDRFALRQSMIDANRWPALKIAVNISATQVRNGRIVDIVKSLLAETGANPSRLELEITEGILLDDEPQTLDTLAAIRRLGLRIALDDFGTGYSSLSYLRRFPVDKIKIDRAFVANLGVRPESDAIVRAIVNLADALDIGVIAEGVETASQLERLGMAGCRQIQGFVFAMPVAADQIDGLAARALPLAA